MNTLTSIERLSLDELKTKLQNSLYKTIKIQSKKTQIIHEFSYSADDYNRLTETTILRFLRGRKGDVEVAFNAIVRYIQWRKDNVDVLDMKAVEEFKNLGVGNVDSFDIDGKPCIHILVKRYNKNTRDLDKTRSYIIYLLEEALKKSNPMEEKLTLLFDMEGFSLYCMDYEITKILVDILSYNYPETLDKAVIVSAPMIFSGFWMIIKPWLDPVTAAKVQFIKKNNIQSYARIEE